MLEILARRAARHGSLPLAALVWVIGACAARDSGDLPAPAPDTTTLSAVAEAPAWSSDSLVGVIGAIAAEAGGQVGVTAIHLESGRRVAWNGERRLPMASVYKLPIAIEVLSQVERGALSLEDSITIHPSEFVGGAKPLAISARGRPVTVTIGRLLAYMLIESDNTASDALLRVTGGPEVVRGRLARLGSEAIDVSRYESEIFAEARARGGAVRWPDPEDLRDTATSAALADLLALVHRDAGLDIESRALLLRHLAATSLGPGRIKGLLPPGTPVAHKTGTFGPVTNDIGILTLPDGSHVAIAVLLLGPDGPVADRERTIARITRAVYDAFAPQPADSTSATGPTPTP